MLATGQAHTCGAATLNSDLGDLGIADQATALPLEQAHQALDQGTGTAHRPVHTMALFQRRDQAVDLRHRERIATNQQRMQAHHHAQLGVAQMLGRQTVERLPRAHAHHRR